MYKWNIDTIGYQNNYEINPRVSLDLRELAGCIVASENNTYTQCSTYFGYSFGLDVDAKSQAGRTLSFSEESKGRDAEYLADVKNKTRASIRTY